VRDWHARAYPTLYINLQYQPTRFDRDVVAGLSAAVSVLPLAGVALGLWLAKPRPVIPVEILRRGEVIPSQIRDWAGLGIKRSYAQMAPVDFRSEFWNSPLALRFNLAVLCVIAMAVLFAVLVFLLVRYEQRLPPMNWLTRLALAALFLGCLTYVVLWPTELARALGAGGVITTPS
jgi:hypothetical protein